MLFNFLKPIGKFYPLYTFFNAKKIIKSVPIIVTFIIVLSSCKKDDNESVIPVEETFTGPVYSDNYTTISSWTSRSQWNLANVHDPTVEKSGDYYYMYQTDASYGNTHEGQGHYPYRRSKDLVNWEFLGMAFKDAPVWIKDSLNNKRRRIGLPALDNPTYGFWAPHIQKVGNKFRLYYSVVVTNPIVGSDPNISWSERAFIGLAESDDLSTNNWTDKGMVVCSEQME